MERKITCDQKSFISWSLDRYSVLILFSFDVELEAASDDAHIKEKEKRRTSRNAIKAKTKK
jgi:hypothetical protein